MGLEEIAGATMEHEVSPQLPTSGQIMGALVRGMGLSDPTLRSKTAQRHFSGRLENLVKESSRSEIIEAVAHGLTELGLEPTPPTGEETAASGLATMLDRQAVHWDRLRAFLLPRMSRVYPSHLAAVWRPYARLAAIDLALRATAHLRLAGAHQASLDFLDWVSVDRRGAYLNEKRKDAKVSVMDLAEAADVHENTVEGWVYRGARPSDEHLAEIGRALGSKGGPDERELMIRDLRRLYWVSDIAEVLGPHIGIEAVADIAARLRRYASQAYLVINDGSAAAVRRADLEDLAARGARAALARPVLAELIRCEPDGEWRADLAAAGSGWLSRVLGVNLQVHRAEVDALVQETDGRILEDWDIRDPRAYDHYRRSMELQMQGKMDEALAEVARATALDPLDPANHFTLGSAKGGIGARNGDEALVKEGLEACWVAVTLDPNWVLPWTEIGWILVNTGREREAVEHLRAVSPECRPLDSRYYAALGVALRESGDFTGSLAALKSSLRLNPNDKSVAVAAAGAALLAGDKIRSNRYRRVARHLGASDEVDRDLKLIEAIKSILPTKDFPYDHNRSIAYLDAAIRRNPGAAAYLARGRAHFLKGEDGRAISDLDAALRLEPSSAAAHLLRGIVYGYMGRHDQVVSDMSEAIRLSPGNAMAYYYRSLAHGEQDALDLAIADLDEVTRLDPGRVDAYRARGDCYRYKKDYDRAIADFDSALQLDPEGALSYRGRGAAFRMKGEFDRAIADHDAALRLNPEDAFARRFRGDAYLAKGDYGRAVADFDIALRMDSADEIAYRGRGNARLFSGELDLAMADFNAAIECNPASAVAIYGHGVVLEVMGDPEGAENDYRRARELGYDESI